MFVLLFITVASKNKITIDQVSVILLGVVYIGFGFNYMIEARLAEQWIVLDDPCVCLYLGIGFRSIFCRFQAG